jgi:hypothetical protein
LELAALAKETGLDITVCHYPPGTSKWNKIEHRMFSFISMNWRGRPLVSYRTIIELIAATTTTTGLTVRADEDLNFYESAWSALPTNAWRFSSGDWLRANPAAVPAYPAFKRSLAAISPDIGTYAEVKDPVVDFVVLMAEPWAAAVGWHL